MENKFSLIYKTGLWGNGSGPGSYRKCTIKYLKFLENFIDSYNIKSIVDIGCGDWQMLRHFNFSNSVLYYGYDVVKDLINRNNYLYRTSNICFYHLNSLADYIKDADLIIAKDVLQHWENKYIIYFLKNIINKYKYALIINDFKKNTVNQDIKIGNCRPLNLQKNPFYYSQFDSYSDMMFCNTLKRIYKKTK